MQKIKKQLLQQILQQLDVKIEALKVSIKLAKESRDNESKSSVGDKYETGRTLMQLEVEKNRVQLNRTESLKNEISNIKKSQKNKQIEFGSLVITPQNNYFISAAIGMVKLDHKNYYCISLASPIGKLLHGKKTGDEFNFRGNTIQILDIF